MDQSINYNSNLTKKEKDKTSIFKSKLFQEVIGSVSFFLGIFVLISMASYDYWDRSFTAFSKSPVNNYGGIIGAYTSDFILNVFGLSGFLIPFIIILYGIRRILNKKKKLVHLIGVSLLLPGLSTFIQLILSNLPSFKVFHEFKGGIIGTLLAKSAISLLSTAGAYLLSLTIITVSIILLNPVSLFSLVFNRKIHTEEQNKRITDPQMQEIQEINQPSSESYKTYIKKTEILSRKTPQTKGDYALPPLDLLHSANTTVILTKEEISSNIAGLEKKLLDFGVKGKIKQANPGPVVTMYEFEPAAGIKINRIISLSDDLALALRAPSIRVYPIAGKAAIGIEVPNKKRTTVYLREIIASETFQKSTHILPLALGKDIFGNPVVTDLTKMPHLLVAGATGSGKSIFINSLILSILYKADPSEVKMLMIDPKLLELSAYSDIPHLITPVIINPKEASSALQKMVFEMERRYKLLADRGAKNIENFNNNVEEAEKIPYIIIFIDELADLMFTAPADVESAITRLAQMARASGIHLILATQRPSVDVITGLIKANFPARISFQLTTKVDSRTILDTHGAEQLLGMGDMLFMIPGAKIVRVHGAYVSEKEVAEITQFIRDQRKPNYTFFQNLTIHTEKTTDEELTDERDEIYEKVIEFAKSAGEVSISGIQRRFKIGYNRAARIMELLEEDGLVGPPKGAGKPRDFIGK
ncbi:MAG: DNA translocase FtsK [Thermodesulfovibrionales bacterium]|nr:DNA translocase FtsK [Thermodesulfovibrionales bacterium]